MELIISRIGDNQLITRKFHYSNTESILQDSGVKFKNINIYLAGEDDEDFFNEVYENNILGLLKYLMFRNYPDFGEDDIELVASYGHIEMVKYLLRKGFEANQDSIDMAAEYGHIEMVKYLESKGLEVGQNGINDAAKNGHMEIVKYLLKKSPNLKLNIPENMKIIFDNFLIFN